MQKIIQQNQVKIIILLIAIVGLSFLEKFPYFNTFLAYPYPWNSFLLLFLLSVILFRLRETFTFGTALLFAVFAGFLSIFGKITIAEKVGEIVYFLTWFALLQMIVLAWFRENEKK